MSSPSERAFETAICESLVSSGGYTAATAEIKNHLTGQTAEDAKAQYRCDRDPRCAVLRRAIVHFAVDTEQVFMTTRLSGDSTRFLPFNRGDGDRAGNPARTGYRTGYLWEEVWSRNAWLDLLARFVLVTRGLLVEAIPGLATHGRSSVGWTAH